MNEGVPIPAEAREIPDSGIVVVYHRTEEDQLSSIIGSGLIPDFGGDSEYSRGMSQDGGPVRDLNKIFNEVARRKGVGFLRTECVFADLKRRPVRFPGVNLALSVKPDLCYVADRRLFDRSLRYLEARLKKYRQISQANAAIYWDGIVRLDQFLMNRDGFEDPEVLLPHGNGVVKMQIVDDEWKEKHPLWLSAEPGQE